MITLTYGMLAFIIGGVLFLGILLGGGLMMISLNSTINKMLRP